MVAVPGDLQIGARIREIRELVGMQAQELGAEVDLDPSAISNIERGKRSVKSSELSAIARALGVSALAILDRESLLGRLPVAPRTSSGTVLRGEVLERLTGLSELHQILVEWEPPLSRHDFPRVDTNDWLQAAPALASWAHAELGEVSYGPGRFSGFIERIEEKLRVDVIVEDREDDNVTGASVTDPEFLTDLCQFKSTRP